MRLRVSGLAPDPQTGRKRTMPAEPFNGRCGKAVARLKWDITPPLERPTVPPAVVAPTVRPVVPLGDGDPTRSRVSLHVTVIQLHCVNRRLGRR